jgi:hypothetical protein
MPSVPPEFATALSLAPEVAKTFALLLEIPEVLIEPLAALGQIGIVNISGNP